MDDILSCCCGLDIHKESIVACLLQGSLEAEMKPVREIREFSTYLADLVTLRSWLEQHGCQYVAMESTGIYWQPIYMVLEESLTDEMHLLVVNARHMKNVPGRKTDMRDAEWIATLLRAGLLKGSYVPERDIRDLRQFTRYQKAVVRDITSQKNRIEKLLQSNGFRLSSFLTDIFGVSGIAIMEQLVEAGRITPQTLDDCLKRRARAKAGDILTNMNGTLSVSQRRLLRMQLAHLRDLQDNLQEVEQDICQGFAEFEDLLDQLKTIPGISETASYAILAEIRADMGAYPTAQHLCSWAGLAPGNYESAGKKKRQRINPGNPYLKTILCEVAWSIARHKKLYLSSCYWRLKQRTDSKRAIIALARMIVVIIYAMLKAKQPFDEERFMERKVASEHRRTSHMVHELTNLGYVVSMPA